MENVSRFKKVGAGLVSLVVMVAIVAMVGCGGPSKSDIAASDKLSLAYMNFSAGNQEQGIALLNDTITNHSKSPAAYQARLLLGDMFINQGNFDEALRYYTETSKSGNPKEIRALAAARIIFLNDQKGDLDGAIAAASEFVKKYPNHFLVRDEYMNLARYYFYKGSLEDLKRVYNEVLTKFPATDEAAVAERMLANLG